MTGLALIDGQISSASKRFRDQPFDIPNPMLFAKDAIDLFELALVIKHNGSRSHDSMAILLGGHHRKFDQTCGSSTPEPCEE
jgi:hypothetical protein